MKFKIILGALVLAVIALGSVYLNKDLNNSDRILDLIISRLGPTGEIVDHTGDIGMTGYKDVGYYIDDHGYYYITYGKLEMEFEKDDFSDEALLEKLLKVGIEVQQNKKTGEIRFLYKGELMDQWAK